MAIISCGKTQNASLGQATTNDDFRVRNPRTSQLTFGFDWLLARGCNCALHSVRLQPAKQPTSQPPTSKPAN